MFNNFLLCVSKDPESAEAATYASVASGYDDYNFGLVTNASLTTEFSPKGSKVIIYKTVSNLMQELTQQCDII